MTKREIFHAGVVIFDRYSIMCENARNDDPNFDVKESDELAKRAIGFVEWCKKEDMMQDFRCYWGYYFTRRMRWDFAIEDLKLLYGMEF